MAIVVPRQVRTYVAMDSAIPAAVPSVRVRRTLSSLRVHRSPLSQCFSVPMANFVLFNGTPRTSLADIYHWQGFR